jgi:hypothetical protein
MSLPLPTLVIFQPQDGFEVPPITTKPPVAVQPPAMAQPPPVAGAPPTAAQAVTFTPPVTTQGGVDWLQPVLVTGQATAAGPETALIDLITVQVDDGPLIPAELTAVPDPTLPVDFSATVAIPDNPGLRACRGIRGQAIPATNDPD